MTFVLIGKIITTHGTKGFLKLKSYTEDDFFSYHSFFDERAQPISLQYKGKIKDHFLVTIQDVESIKAASAYINMTIYSHRKELSENEFYFSDLINTPVYDEDNTFIGIVDKVLDFGASPFLVIRKDDQKFVNAFFHKDAIIERKENKIRIKKDFILF